MIRPHITRRTIRQKREAGFTTIEFLAGLALLILPVFFLLITFPSWYERAIMVRMSAREAARSYVVTGNQQQARQIVTDIAANYHVNESDITVDIPNGTLTPGADVTVTVTSKIPLLQLSFLQQDVGGFTYSSSHSEPVDLYRLIPQ